MTGVCAKVIRRCTAAATDGWEGLVEAFCAAERIAAAAGQQSVELSPPFDAPQPPPRPTAPSQPAVLDPHHPLHGMDTVQVRNFD